MKLLATQFINGIALGLGFAVGSAIITGIASLIWVLA